jgi:hypothetical protein
MNSNRDNKGRFLSKHNLNRLPFNEYVVNNDIVIISIKDKKCLIDLINLVKNSYWTLDENGYVINTKRTRMHRLILNIDDSLLVDHINHNTLDNRLINLRQCTRTTNAQNSIKKDYKCTSKFKGVNYRKDRKYWRAYITVNKKTINLGIFSIEKEAAKAYNEAASRYFGEFACLNKIEEE